MRRLGAWSGKLGLLVLLLVPCVLLNAASIARLPQHQHLRDFLFDSYLRIWPRPHDAKLPVTVVAIDDDSLARLGQWPWPRARLGDLINAVAAGHPAAIGIDLVLSEPERDLVSEVAAAVDDADLRGALHSYSKRAVTGDGQLAAALSASGTAVMSVALGDTGSAPPTKAGLAVAGEDLERFLPTFAAAVVPLKPFTEAATGIGAVNWIPDRDHVLRRIPSLLRAGDIVVPSLAVETLRVALDASTIVVKAANASGEQAFGGSKTGISSVVLNDLQIPTEWDGGVRIRYSDTRPHTISAAELLADPSRARELESKVVFIGVTATALGDIKATPVADAVPGVEVHAQMAEHILSGASLHRPDYAEGLERIALTVFAALGGLLGWKLGAVSAALSAVGLSSAAIAGSMAIFVAQGQLFDPMPAVLAVAGTASIMTVTRYRATERERKFIRSAFRQYLSPALVEQLAKTPDRLVLGGEERVMTLLFSDVRGFTTISEQYKTDPQALTQLMNRLLTPLTNVIIERQGTIDKYMGDAIMAFWNAPLDDPRHEHNACSAALAMLHALDGLNDERQHEAEVAGVRYVPLKVGVGLNSGPCVVGNMGSDLHFNYSVLGDAVNLASRLESQSKTYGTPILIGSSTALAVRDEFAVIELDLLQVKGKTEPEPIYALIARRDDANRDQFATLVAHNERMLEAYRAGRWSACLEAILVCRELGRTFGLEDYYKLYTERVRYLMDSPPQENWRGIWIAENK